MSVPFLGEKVFCWSSTKECSFSCSETDAFARARLIPVGPARLFFGQGDRHACSGWESGVTWVTGNFPRSRTGDLEHGRRISFREMQEVYFRRVAGSVWSVDQVGEVFCEDLPNMAFGYSSFRLGYAPAVPAGAWRGSPVFSVCGDRCQDVHGQDFGLAVALSVGLSKDGMLCRSHELTQVVARSGRSCHSLARFDLMIVAS